MPKDAILCGLLLLLSLFMSHCSVKVPGTVWVETTLLWIVIAMPPGSGKTPLFNFLTSILQRVREKVKLAKQHPSWLLDEASFEKMGELMAHNHSKLLAMYDELSTFLAQMNVYRGKGLCESHDLSTFLSLYTAKSWSRSTGLILNSLRIQSSFTSTLQNVPFIANAVTVCLRLWQYQQILVSVASPFAHTHKKFLTAPFFFFLVSGDANFSMDRTALTVGGFTQPIVAKALVELPLKKA